MASVLFGADWALRLRPLEKHHKKNPAWRDFFYALGTLGLERASRPYFQGRLESDKKAFASRFRPKRANRHGSGNGRTSWRMPDQTRFGDGALLAGERYKALRQAADSPPDCDKAPPLRFFIPHKQTDDVAAKPQNSAPAAERPVDHRAAPATRRFAAQRSADARVPRARRRPLIRPHSTVKPNSSTLVPNHFS